MRDHKVATLLGIIEGQAWTSVEVNVGFDQWISGYPIFVPLYDWVYNGTSKIFWYYKYLRCKLDYHVYLWLLHLSIVFVLTWFGYTLIAWLLYHSMMTDLGIFFIILSYLCLIQIYRWMIYTYIAWLIVAWLSFSCLMHDCLFMFYFLALDDRFLGCTQTFHYAH